MSAAMQQEISEVLQRVRDWSAEQRLALAEQLLSTLHEDVRPARTRGLPENQIRGMLATTKPPPDDRTVREWIQERRLEKYTP